MSYCFWVHIFFLATFIGLFTRQTGRSFCLMLWRMVPICYPYDSVNRKASIMICGNLKQVWLNPTAAKSCMPELAVSEWLHKLGRKYSLCKMWEDKPGHKYLLCKMWETRNMNLTLAAWVRITGKTLLLHGMPVIFRTYTYCRKDVYHTTN